tara:strand:- start:3984 stop:4757 length:774 start_codon:yes stop_codon:yes gene_type:complete
VALSRIIKGVKHYAYESEAEFRTAHPNEKLIKNWREAKQGQWCLSDDGKIVQVLLKDTMKGNKSKEEYIRTVIGMITVRKSTTLVGDITDSLYRFVKRHSYDSRIHGGMTKQKKIFSKYIAMGLDPESAYIKAYPKTTSTDDARRKSKLLLKSKTVRDQVDKEIEELMADVGITKRYLLESTKDVVDKTDVKDNDKLRALETLMKISGMLNTEKKSESIALIQEFTGFSKEKLKAFEQGMLSEKKKELTNGDTSSNG